MPGEGREGGEETKVNTRKSSRNATNRWVWRQAAPPTYDGAQVVHVDGGVAGARRQQAVQLRRGAVVVVPPQRVDDLVVLLDAAQLLQAGGLVHLNTPS